MTPAHIARHYRLGIACVILASLLFTGLDALTKHFSTRIPIPFTLMIRYWAFAGLTLAIAARSPGGVRAAIRSKRPVIQSVRGLLLLGEIYAIAESFKTIPLADMQSMFALYPLIIMVMAVFVLKEYIRWQNWLAASVGFCGLLIVVRPGFATIHPETVLVLSASVMYALYNVLTRMVGQVDTPATTFLYTGLVGMVITTGMGVFQWTPIAAADWIGIAGLCMTGVLGHMLVIRSLHYAPASVLQPFNYLQLIWSTIMGYLAFGAIPDLWTVVGGAIVALSGLYALTHSRTRTI